MLHVCPGDIDNSHRLYSQNLVVTVHVDHNTLRAYSTNLTTSRHRCRNDACIVANITVDSCAKRLQIAVKIASHRKVDALRCTSHCTTSMHGKVLHRKTEVTLLSYAGPC